MQFRREGVVLLLPFATLIHSLEVALRGRSNFHDPRGQHFLNHQQRMQWRIEQLHELLWVGPLQFKKENVISTIDMKSGLNVMIR